jgi:hypothetical protein
MAQERFTLQWDRPFYPGGATHVSLFEGGREPMHIVASGHGADDTDALGDLLKALKERKESAAAIAHVAEEYGALTGKGSPRPRS